MVLEAEFEDPTSTLSSGEGHPHPAGPGDLLPGRQADHPRPVRGGGGHGGGLCQRGRVDLLRNGQQGRDTVTLRLRTEGRSTRTPHSIRTGAGPVWRESWTAAIWSFRPRSRGRSCCWIRERCLCWLSPCAAAASSPYCWPCFSSAAGGRESRWQLLPSQRTSPSPWAGFVHSAQQKQEDCRHGSPPVSFTPRSQAAGRLPSGGGRSWLPPADSPALSDW